MNVNDSNYFIECVPNISEGKDLNVVKKIINAATTDYVKVLHQDSGAAANRTVITLAGPVLAMLESIKKLYAAAALHIDMTIQKGTHPRLGAVDICPFIPFDIKNTQDLKARVKKLSEEVSAELNIPIFLYAKSSIGKYKTLPDIRKGEYEQLINDKSQMRCQADFGEAYSNPGFGGSVIGVRDFMLAYNVNLSTKDIKLAKDIAKKMRAIRKDHAQYKGADISNLQILAWYIDDFDCCQISTNIHDTRNLSIVDVFRFVDAISQEYGVAAISSELIGMIPELVLNKALKEKDINNEEHLIQTLGLDFSEDFSWSNRVIERVLKKNRIK